MTKTRSVKLGLNNIKNEGIFLIPTDHFGNSQRSDEEADIIQNALVDEENLKNSNDEVTSSEVEIE